jgi:hypothetical protein
MRSFIKYTVLQILLEGSVKEDEVMHACKVFVGSPELFQTELLAINVFAYV